MDQRLQQTLTRVLAGRADVRLALVFGSQARGEARPDSDVDVAVDAPDVDLLAQAAALTQATGRDVQVVDIATAGVSLLDEILCEDVCSTKGAPGQGTFLCPCLELLGAGPSWYARMRDAGGRGWHVGTPLERSAGWSRQ